MFIIKKEQANIVNYNKENGRFSAKVKIKNIDASKKKDKYDLIRIVKNKKGFV